MSVGSVLHVFWVYCVVCCVLCVLFFVYLFVCPYLWIPSSISNICICNYNLDNVLIVLKKPKHYDLCYKKSLKIPNW